jgi:mRNA-degrading endonuclease YafQ of YafQ-DinJ toxin-antitoxin module
VKLEFTERFQSDARALDPQQRTGMLDAILALPRALGTPHLHAGLGLRKIHASGIWEARVGRDLRLVFTLATDILTLIRVGNHDDVRRYLKSL